MDDIISFLETTLDDNNGKPSTIVETDEITRNLGGLSGSKVSLLYHMKFVNSQSVPWYMPLFGIWIPAFLGLFGLVGNIVNICVLVKMGVRKDSCNIILVGLSVADFAVITFYLWDVAMFAYQVYIKRQDVNAVPFVFWVISRASSTHPRQLTTHITCLLTTFLSIQRCISVAYPFTVARTFGPRRTALCVALLFLSAFVTCSPIYLSSIVAFRIYHGVIAVHEHTPSIIPTNVLVAAYIVNKLIIRPACLITVIICYFILAKKMRTSQRCLRDTTSAETINGQASNTVANQRMISKEKKVIKTVVTISAIFVICYLPETIIVPCELVIGTVFGNRRAIIADIVKSILEGINSSCNIVILCIFSTNYRAALKKLCVKRHNLTH